VTLHAKLKVGFELAKTIALRDGYCPALIEALKEIRQRYATTTINLSFKSAYRARLLKPAESVTNLSQVWHPGAHQVWRFGRANLPHQPMLYCCDGPNTAIKEVGGKSGDLIAIVEMGLADAERPAHIFSLGELRARKRTKKGVMGSELDTMLERMKAAGIDMQRALMVDGFYADVFRQPGESLYPLTAAIAQDYLSPDEIDGVSYPTVATPLGQNLALKPASAIRLLSVRSVKLTRIVKPLRDTFFARDEMASRFLHADGRIEWWEQDQTANKNSQNRSQNFRAERT
jgi:hypothetical protein